MQIKVESRRLPKSQSLIIPLFKNEKKVPAFLNQVDKKLIGQLIKNKEFKGEKMETALDLSAGTVGKLLLVGLGEKDKLSLDTLFKSAGTAVMRLKKAKAADTVIWLPKEITAKLGAENVGQVLAESALISGYSYLKYKSKEKGQQIKQVTIFVENKDDERALQKGARVGKLIGTSVDFTRDYGNSPSNEITPTRLAELAKEITDQYPAIFLKVLGKKEIEKEGMGGLLGVARGSAEEPKFIIMEYWGADGKAAKKLKEKPIVLVGKGITFDTGGISIKPAKSMEEMKFDMAGGGAVLGVVRTAAALKLAVNLVGLVPATENMPSGSAYKPGDILRILDGTTVEVLNTDAEGRLILADGLVYARRYNPEIVIDMATLTGACVVALGEYASGLFTEDEKLQEELLHASTHTGDKVWPMPIYEEYMEQAKSPVADIKNIFGNGGGAITATIFLKHFVKGYRWAHLDIAGTAWTVKGMPHLEPGATGASVRLLTQFLRERAGKHR